MSKMFYYVACVIVSVLIFNVSAKSVKTRDIDNEPKCCCWTNKFSAEGNIVILPMSGSGLSATENRHVRLFFVIDYFNIFGYIFELNRLLVVLHMMEKMV